MKRLIRLAMIGGGAGLLLGLIAGLVLALTTPTTYGSTSQLFVSVRSGTSAAERSQAAKDRVATYTSLAGSDSVLGPAAAEAGLPLLQAQKGVGAKTVPGTNLITLQTVGSDPAQARVLNLAVIRNLQTLFNSLENSPGGPVDASLVIVTPPADGIAISGRFRVLAVGAAGGLAIGLGIAYLRWRIRTQQPGATTGLVPGTVVNTTTESHRSHPPIGPQRKKDRS